MNLKSDMEMPFVTKKKDSFQAKETSSQSSEVSSVEVLSSESSEKPDRNIGTITFSGTIDSSEKPVKTKYPFKIRAFFGKVFEKLLHRRVLQVLGAVFLIGSFAFGVFGVDWYVRHNAKLLSVLSILPEHPDLILEVNINPDSRQFSLLEEHASAFPGYSLLKKAIDPVGEGKTLSQVFQDSLKQFNIDFNGDIKQALGDSAYVIVSDMSPIGQGIQKGLVASGRSVFQKIAGSFPTKEHLFAFSSPDKEQETMKPRVLGEMTVKGVDSDFVPDKPIDFLVASPIRDEKKALSILQNMQKNAGFEVTQLKYQGFSYFKVSTKDKKESAPDDVSRFVRFRELYHAVVGGNWIMASSENELKEVLNRRASRHLWDDVFSKEPPKTLVENAEYLHVQEELGLPKISNNLIIGYFNVASSSFFKKPSCSSSSCPEGGTPELFQYPERIVFGGLVSLTKDGADIRWTGLRNGESLPGKPESEKFSNLVPQGADGRWLNIFAENEGIKNRFYDFKRSSLTDAGRSSWEEARKAILQTSGIDVERDIIDHMTGSAAFSVLTNANVEPEGVLVVQVDNPEAVRSVINRFVDSIRKVLEGERRSLENMGSVSSCDSSYSVNDTSWYESCLEMEKKYQEMNLEMKKRMDALIAASHITETVTPEGKIYSLKLSNEFPYSFFSFDFAFRQNNLIFGSHFAPVVAFLHEIGPQGTEKKLSENSLYQKVKSVSSEASYRNTFVVTRGLWEVVRYAMKSVFSGVSDSASGEYSARAENMMKEIDDSMFAFGAILRTIQIMGSDSVSRNGFETLSSRFVIKALPAEEKERAEKILERIPVALGVAQSKAQVAAFKAQAHSVLPKAVLQCDAGALNAKNLIRNGSTSCFSANNISILSQSCGPTGNGSFRFTITSSCLSVKCTANVTENDVTFSPC